MVWSVNAFANQLFILASIPDALWDMCKLSISFSQMVSHVVLLWETETALDL